MSIPPARQPRHPRRRASEVSLFDSWVDAHAKELYRFAFRLCGDSAAAEDLVQETYHDVWKQRRPLRTVREPRAWLFQVLRRKYYRLRRAEQRWPGLQPLIADKVEDSREGFSSRNSEASDSLQAALDTMSDRLKLPLLMVFVQGMTCAQTAEQLDIPLGTVLSRIYRAKVQLREAIRIQDNGNMNRGRDTKNGGEDERENPRFRIGGA